jgi:mRNA interferase MazF
MKSRRGDVVLLDYPFSDSSGSKVRPALVVQSDWNNARLSCTIVALITKNIRRAAREPAHLLIDISTPDGQSSGLRVTSAVTCNNLYTVNEKHLVHTIGQLSTPTMLEIDACLKSSLGII